jgi:DnaJ-domain-containing protein 1
MESSRESVERIMKYITEILLPHLGKRVDVMAKLVIQELPRLEALLLEGFEIMFSPRQLIRQVVIVAAVQLIIMAGETLGNIGNSLVVFLSKAEREQQEVIKELSQAISYKEWKKVAARLDYMR